MTLINAVAIDYRLKCKKFLLPPEQVLLWYSIIKPLCQADKANTGIRYTSTSVIDFFQLHRVTVLVLCLVKLILDDITVF